MKKRAFLLGCFLLLFFMASFSQQGERGNAQGQDRLSGKNVKAIYLADPNVPFKLIITDDPSDEIEAKGMVSVDMSGGFQFEQPFHLGKGKSAKYGFGLEDKVEKVTIILQEGSIFIDHEGKLKKEEKKEAPALKPSQVEIPVSRGTFSADYLMDVQGQVVKGKIYLKDHLYRFDVLADETKEKKIKYKTQSQSGTSVEVSVEIANLSFIIDQKSGPALIINHDEKEYFEGMRDDSSLYNPVEAHYGMCQLYSLIDKGEEKVGDLICDRKELRWDQMLIQVAWISKKYLFPVKIINYIEGKEHMVFEVKNIKEERLDQKMFEVPSGYKKLTN